MLLAQPPRAEFLTSYIPLIPSRQFSLFPLDKTYDWEDVISISLKRWADNLRRLYIPNAGRSIPHGKGNLLEINIRVTDVIKMPLKVEYPRFFPSINPKFVLFSVLSTEPKTVRRFHLSSGENAIGEIQSVCYFVMARWQGSLSPHPRSWLSRLMRKVTWLVRVIEWQRQIVSQWDRGETRLTK